MSTECISIGNNSKNYWYFICSSLCYIMRRLTFYFEIDCDETKYDCPDLSRANGEKVKHVPSCHPLITIILMGIGMSLSFIFEIISRQLQVNKEVTKKIDNVKQTNTFIKRREKNTKSLYFGLVLILSILDGLGIFFAYYKLSNVEPSDEENQDNAYKFIGKEHIHCLIEFTLVAILSSIFLRRKMAKHHWFFSGIMLLGLLIVLLSNIGLNLIIEDSLYFGMLCSVFHAIYYIIYKYMLDSLFASPYLTIGIEGSIIVVITFIITVIYGVKIVFDWYFVVNGIMYIIMSLGYNIFIILLLRDFGPTHRAVTGLFATVLGFIIVSILGQEFQIQMVLLEIIGDIVLIFGVFGFNEMIILHCWDLHYDTGKEIHRRSMAHSENEVEIANRIVDDNDNDNEDENDSDE